MIYEGWTLPFRQKNDMTDLNTIWFVLIFFFVAAYLILDGFDLGIGILHLFSRSNEERRTNINAIAPFWDANEVWLLATGGTLFAVFPLVYATLLSSFYSVIMLLLVSLIFRAVSIKFREGIKLGRVGLSDKTRKSFWDWSFGIGSLTASFILGVIAGNLIKGIPLNETGIYTGQVFELLNPYALLTGLLNVVMFAMHGAAYMTLKTEKVILERMRRIIYILFIAFIVLFLLAASITPFISPFLYKGLSGNSLFRIFSLLLFIAAICMILFLKQRRHFVMFLSSSVIIACTTGLLSIHLFPRLIPSNINDAYSLTITNSDAPVRTLYTMLIITMITIPIIIAYTVYIYRVFRGKVKSEKGY